MKKFKEILIGLLSIVFSMIILYFSHPKIILNSASFWSIFAGYFLITSTFLSFVFYLLSRSEVNMKLIFTTSLKAILVTFIPFTILSLIYFLLSKKHPEFHFKNIIFIENNHYIFAIILIILLSIYLFYLRSLINRRRIVLDSLNAFLENLYVSKEYKNILHSSPKPKDFSKLIERVLLFMIQLIDLYASPFHKLGKFVSYITKFPFVISAWLLYPNYENKNYDIIGFNSNNPNSITIYNKLINKHKPVFLNKTMLTKLKKRLNAKEISEESYNDLIKKYKSAAGYFSSKVDCDSIVSFVFKNIEEVEHFDHSYRKYIKDPNYYHRSLILIPLCISGKHNACLFIFSNIAMHFPKNMFQYLQPLSLFLMFILEQSKIKKVNLL